MQDSNDENREPGSTKTIIVVASKLVRYIALHILRRIGIENDGLVKITAVTDFLSAISLCNMFVLARKLSGGGD